MAKNSVSEWSTVSSGNGDIAGLTLGLDMPPSYVNNAMQEMMAQIKQWKDGYTDPLTGLPVYQSLTVENITVEGVIKLNNTAGNDGQVIVSKGSSASPEWGDAFVTGMIMLWSGSTSSVPNGWRLCDGTGGTPDLRNRFVVGAGDTYAVDTTGGSANAVVVSHSHTGSTNTTGNHNHGGVPKGGNAWFQKYSTGGNWGNEKDGGSGGATSASGNHAHSFTTASSGSSGTDKNLPPYYALCYIMKV